MKRERASNEAAEVRGICCPRCLCGHVPVLYTRPVTGRQRRRRRRCRHCGHEFTTTERVGA